MMDRNPWDHNAECRYCDEQGMHRADCEWLIDVLEQAENYQLLLAIMGVTDYKAAVLKWKATLDRAEGR
jgi:hypothetical protein